MGSPFPPFRQEGLKGMKLPVEIFLCLCGNVLVCVWKGRCACKARKGQCLI